MFPNRSLGTRIKIFDSSGVGQKGNLNVTNISLLRSDFFYSQINFTKIQINIVLKPLTQITNINLYNSNILCSDF
jgi:hypothetical protein